MPRSFGYFWEELDKAVVGVFGERARLSTKFALPLWLMMSIAMICEVHRRTRSRRDGSQKECPASTRSDNVTVACGAGLRGLRIGKPSSSRRCCHRRNASLKQRIVTVTVARGAALCEAIGWLLGKKLKLNVFAVKVWCLDGGVRETAVVGSRRGSGRGGRGWRGVRRR